MAAQLPQPQYYERDFSPKPPPDIQLFIPGPPVRMRRKDVQSNLEGHRRQIAQLPGRLGKVRITTKISCAYSQKMKLLEAAKYPEQAVEGVRLCSVAPKRGIEFSERISAFQVTPAQKPLLEIRVVAQKNI